MFGLVSACVCACVCVCVCVRLEGVKNVLTHAVSLYRDYGIIRLGLRRVGGELQEVGLYSEKS